MRQALAALARIALAALVVAAAQSVYWSPGASLPFSALVTSLAVLSAWRPAWGLLTLAALAPFGRMIAIVWLRGFPIRGAEALTLAVLAGVATRRLWRGQADDPLPGRLTGPWLLFATSVVASAAVLYGLSQFYLDYPGAFFGRLLTYIAVDYQGPAGDPRPWLEPSTFGSLDTAALVIEGVALLLVSARLICVTPGLATRLVAVSVAAGVMAALLSVDALLDAVRASGVSFGSLAGFLTTERVAVHVTKVNTAGSYFALLAVLAGGMAIRAPARRYWWLAACVGLLAGLWLTASMAAIVSCMAVAAAAGLWSWASTGLSRRRQVFAAVLITAVLVMGLARAATRQDVAASFWRRVAITQVSLATMAEAPLFGIGIGDYPLRSQPHVTEAVRLGFGEGSMQPHNYVLQIGVELGVVGLVLFLWALSVTFRQVWTPAGRDSPGVPAVAAVTAFMLSALSGQPMLVDAVAVPVWLVLSVALGQAPAVRPRRAMPAWVPLGVLVIAATVPSRTSAVIRTANLQLAGQGSTLIEVVDGEAIRRVHRLDRPARLFVSGMASAIVVEAEAEEVGPLFLQISGEGFAGIPLALPPGVRRAVCLTVDPGSKMDRPRAVHVVALSASGAPARPGTVWALATGNATPCGAAKEPDPGQTAGSGVY